MNGRVCQESSHWLSPLGRSMMRLHLADSSDIQMERSWEGQLMMDGWMGIAPESVASANSSSQYGWACATWVDFNLTCNYCTYPPPFFLNFHFMKLNSHLFSNWFLACYWSHYSSICPFFCLLYGFSFLCIVFYFVVLFISIKCFKFEHHNPHSKFFFDKKKSLFLLMAIIGVM